MGEQEKAEGRKKVRSTLGGRGWEKSDKRTRSMVEERRSKERAKVANRNKAEKSRNGTEKTSRNE